MSQEKSTCPNCRKEAGVIEDIPRKVSEPDEEDEFLLLKNSELADILIGLGGFCPRILLTDEQPPIKYTRTSLDMYLLMYSAQLMSDTEWNHRIDMQFQWSTSFPEDMWIFWRSLQAQHQNLAEYFIASCESVGPFSPNFLVRALEHVEQLADLHKNANPAYAEDLQRLVSKVEAYMDEKDAKTLQVTFLTDAPETTPFTQSHSVVESTKDPYISYALTLQGLRQQTSHQSQ
jgi:hypothetical protein